MGTLCVYFNSFHRQQNRNDSCVFFSRPFIFWSDLFSSDFRFLGLGEVVIIAHYTQKCLNSITMFIIVQWWLIDFRNWIIIGLTWMTFEVVSTLFPKLVQYKLISNQLISNHNSIFLINFLFVIFLFFCSDFRPSTLEKVQEKVRLRIYQAYAFGVPLMIMAIAIILDNIPNGDFLRPQFGQTRCGFDG